jgi:hypothetical protein
VDVDTEDGKSVVEQLWPVLRLVINSTNVKMIAMMHSFGFAVQDCSPFSVQFDEEADLQKVFMSYLPWTFVFDGVEGSQNDDDNNEADETGNTEEPGGSGRIVPDQAVTDVVNYLLADDEEVEETRSDEEKRSEDETIEVMDDDELDFFGPGLNSSEMMNDFASLLMMTQTPNFTAKALVDRILEASANVELNKREQASASDKQKAKSLTSRWFQKEEKEKKPNQEGTTEDSNCLERD